ncbi:DUF5906 domain-containing protein [Erwinia sp. ACCC 02193]|uniref:DUF5906 domain-containing protein n=1 Tax=Erwinia aeris TaxID=3239803 RepID=A0ABV4EFA1_9GAMM
MEGEKTTKRKPAPPRKSKDILTDNRKERQENTPDNVVRMPSQPARRLTAEEKRARHAARLANADIPITSPFEKDKRNAHRKAAGTVTAKPQPAAPAEPKATEQPISNLRESMPETTIESGMAVASKQPAYSVHPGLDAMTEDARDKYQECRKQGLLESSSMAMARLVDDKTRYRITDRLSGLPESVNGGMDASRIKLGNWVEEGNPEDYLKPAGVIAGEIKHGMGLALASDPAGARGSHQGLYFYTGKVWKPAVNILSVLSDESDRQNMPADDRQVKAIAAALRNRLPFMGETKADAVPFDNGVLMTSGPQAGTMLPHSPDFYFLSTNGITWTDGAPSPVFDRWLDFVTEGNENMRNALRAMFWHVLTNTGLKHFYELTGESNTGKSVASSLCRLLAGGSANEFTITFETLRKGGTHQFAQLPGKRLILMPEQFSDGGPNALAALKALSSGGEDTVSVDIKLGAQFSYCNMAPVVITNNTPLVLKDGSQGIVNRRVTICMNRVVPAAQRDRLLTEKLKAELGSIAWQLMRDFDASTANKALETWKTSSTDLQDVMEAGDIDFAFAKLLTPASDKAAWKIGLMPKDDDLRNGTVDLHPDAGLYPLYVHYRKMMGEERGTVNQRSFSKMILNHLNTIHGDSAGYTAYQLYRSRGINRLRWQPTEELKTLLTGADSVRAQLLDDSE